MGLPPLADAFRDFEREVSANEWPEGLDETIESLLEAEKKLNRNRQGTWEVLQDLRWDLMVQRAETEAPGDAPVFDNARDLLSYCHRAGDRPGGAGVE